LKPPRANISFPNWSNIVAAKSWVVPSIIAALPGEMAMLVAVCATVTCRVLVADAPKASVATT
jgi:hypothetical protein